MAKRNRKSNDGRMTKVIGKYYDFSSDKAETFECEVPYTTSKNIAANRAAEILGLGDNVAVNVIEIVNAPLVTLVYDAQDLREHAICIYDANANVDYNEETHSLVPFTMYYYTAWLWVTDEVDCFTEKYLCESTRKNTKGDARAYLKMCYEKEHDGMRVIGIHDEKRHDASVFAYIENTELAKVRTHEK